jgi:hypothetical protein
MRKIIALRTRLLTEPAKLSRLDAATAWPLRQVVDPNGALLGVVLQRIPDSFFHDLRLPSGSVKRGIREVQFLFMAPDRALRGGTLTPTPVERLTICRDFAAALAFLHGEMRVAFGDINARNAVFRLGLDPTVMFVDCDAVRVVGDVASAPQLNAPDWDPPAGEDALGRPTDLYKLGLFVLRCLTPGHNCSINRDPDRARGVLDTHGLALLTAAVGRDPGGRPSAEEWHRYLRRALGETLAPPRLKRVELDRTIVAAGEPVTLSWSAEEADTIEASGVGLPAMSAPGIAGSGTIILHPIRTGRITVTAHNKLGEVSEQVGPVAVFDLPSLQDLPVPMPRLDLPRLSPLELPAVGRVLPRFPKSAPVPLPPMANVMDAWTEPETRTPPEPIDLGGPPPLFGSGPSAVPFDLTEIVADPGDERKVHS